ncbi:uncharacterized protein PITG_08007 [Phytophthora infestans T30-4]|uniref:Uncharacterized protein n=1 Tax=Phytophthora infestans (strain T30-4) TaxID=403677 RepID=D0N993_PHYIT|nr:uncharacterized protein PITG_08007 [Phytophthora infestans T30-4]EEY54381.1 hypothetical protein PITG_08007 [Phytophthora infestans T30-4]|eukprot:XP_002904203.1 hypothetical protein PITG_08007 [Phytophthora infestans T30-4]
MKTKSHSSEEVAIFETRLDELLQRCVIRNQQIEEIRRFASLRRQQKQQEDGRQRQLVHDWLQVLAAKNKTKIRAQRFNIREWSFKNFSAFATIAKEAINPAFTICISKWQL